jgi:hypothetical protein
MNQKEIERLAEKISIDRTAIDRQRILEAAGAALESSKSHAQSRILMPLTGRFPLLICAGSLAAAFLIVSSLVACFVLFGKVADLRKELRQARRDVALAQQNIASAQTDDTATINFYLEEHKDVIAQHSSLSSATPKPAQMRVNQHDILYYEFFDDGPEYMSPGIIVRAPSTQQQINSPQTPTIANGHTLTLSEARETSNFDLVAPPRLYPAYRFEKIRRIEDRDALHLLYTDGIDTISLFEQHLDAKHRLEPKDFREYAVYRNKGQSGGTILAWRDEELSYVLIGNTELSHLMDMAQSISATR